MSNAFSFQSLDCTHAGNVRQFNEDSLLSKPDIGLWVVADGMGGHEAGDMASQLIVSDLDVMPDKTNLAEFIDDVEDALLLVNQKLRAHSIESFNGMTVGSTVVSLVLKGNTGVALWVGDSRLYRFREDKMEQLTKDHSEVQAQIDLGLLSPENAETSAIKNMLSRAVGAFDELDVDVNAFSVQQGDCFLLCSDGLYNELSNDEIFQIVSNTDFGKLPEVLLSECLSKEARDNVSLIMVKVS